MIQVNRLLIVKSDKKLYLLHKGKRVFEYRISLGRNPVWHKHKKGDKRTPEGDYVIDEKDSTTGKYHLGLHISYPNKKDLQRAKIRGEDPGGGIYIHGLRKGFGWVGGLHRLVNWTNGCIAVTNPEIEELFQLVKVGTPVSIKP